LKTKDLYERGKQIADLFRNEHILDDRIDAASFSDGLYFVNKHSLVKVDANEEEIHFSENNKLS